MAGRLTLYKLVVLGDGGVGKTALTIQLCLNHFVETYDPTIEDSYRKQVAIDDIACMLEVLDTAGQEEYTALRDQWIRDGEGFVLVYSISSRSSFQRIEKFHRQIQRVKEGSQQSSPTYPQSPLSAASAVSSDMKIPIMLVGNKCDRITEREVSTQEGSALARELGCDFVEASAKNCINVERAFYDVVRKLRDQRSLPRSADTRRALPSSMPAAAAASPKAFPPYTPTVFYRQQLTRHERDPSYYDQVKREQDPYTKGRRRDQVRRSRSSRLRDGPSSVRCTVM